MFLVVLFSFGENDLASFPMEGITLHWYRTLFAKADFWKALGNSAIMGCSVGVASIVIGTLAALMLARERESTATPLLGLLSLPLMMSTAPGSVPFVSHRRWGSRWDSRFESSKPQKRLCGTPIWR